MRVLLVEDHPAMRFALATAIERAGIGEVVGETGRAEEALAFTRESKPELVMLDIRLEGETTGLELCRDLKALSDPPRVLVHTSYNSASELYLCFLSGADGYVHKSSNYRELVEAIRLVGEGKPVRITGSGSAEAAEPRLRMLADGTLLTARERDVLDLILRGYPNDRIARELYVSLDTVKSHTRKVYRKLEVKNRKELFRSSL